MGLGNAGLPLSAVIAENGHSVIGVDVDESRCAMINRGENPLPQEIGLDELIRRHGGRNLKATSNYEDARGSELFIVIVPLFVDEGNNPDLSIIEGALRCVGRVISPGSTVVMETTVPPGTTAGPVRGWLEEESGLSLGEFYLAHSPERIMSGYCISRLREFPKVIGGVDGVSGEKAFQLYSRFIPNLKKVSSSEVAELIKVMEGCYRDVNISLANELFLIAEELGIDFYEAREYANHEFCHIHMPSTGVGGHCIPVYPWFLIKEMERRERFDSVRLLRTAREENDGMIDFWAERIVMASLKLDLPLSRVRICIEGISYRAGAKGLYHSRNFALARLLMRKGLAVSVSDSLYSCEELEALGLRAGGAEGCHISFDPYALKIKYNL
ncbi:MAG: nucleotide sugar dehydrogenase [Methanotrichaceae archaeon]|nr:nucleotide sugar dehydrogenase [Methanotrichaceae archaeon]